MNKRMRNIPNITGAGRIFITAALAALLISPVYAENYKIDLSRAMALSVFCIGIILQKAVQKGFLGFSRRRKINTAIRGTAEINPSDFWVLK